MWRTVLLVGLVFGMACSGLGAGPETPAGAASPPSASGGAPAVAPSGRALPPGIAALVEGARREGRTVLFGTSSTPDEEEALERAFADFYGFPLDISAESGLHPQKVVEIVTAARSGVRSGIDLFWSSETILNDLHRANLLRDAAWLTPLELPAEELMLRGQAARVHDSFLINVLYNGQRVAAADAPRRYYDLLDPRWQGAIVMPRSANLLLFLAYVYGEDGATELAEGLVRRQVALVPTYPDVSNRVATGEYLVGIGQMAERQARRGAPLVDAPLDIGIVIPWGVALMADSEHPAAATLLAYFLTQPEGQRALDQIWANSRVTAVDTAAWRVARDKELVTIPLEWVEREQARLVRKYADILGIR
jgi:iron(III) transport system substrate-binding protein